MDSEIIVAIIAFLGTTVGSSVGVLASSRLTNHRLKELEKKVEAHNCIVKRTYVLEKKMKVANHRILDLEKGGKHG